jgi:hypothetical protein
MRKTLGKVLTSRCGKWHTSWFFEDELKYLRIRKEQLEKEGYYTSTGEYKGQYSLCWSKEKPPNE